VTGPLQSHPDEKYAYGNQGINIAARVVEVVGGVPYEEFLQKRFFDPLGMKDTTFWPSEAQVARLAGVYGPNKDKTGFARGGIGFLTKPLSDRTRRAPGGQADRRSASARASGTRPSSCRAMTCSRASQPRPATRGMPATGPAPISPVECCRSGPAPLPGGDPAVALVEPPQPAPRPVSAADGIGRGVALRFG
jgi:CubicO group peptidase (beta-lactamase class C family)